LKNNIKESYKNTKKVWKYHTYIDLIHEFPRATKIVNVIYEISESFARNYLHKYNPGIFGNFISDVKQMSGILKSVWNNDWDSNVMNKKDKYWTKKKVLYKCIAKLKDQALFKEKYWRIIQKDRAFYKKI